MVGGWKSDEGAVGLLMVILSGYCTQANGLWILLSGYLRTDETISEFSRLFLSGAKWEVNVFWSTEECRCRKAGWTIAKSSRVSDSLCS